MPHYYEPHAEIPLTVLQDDDRPSADDNASYRDLAHVEHIARMMALDLVRVTGVVTHGLVSDGTRITELETKVAEVDEAIEATGAVQDHLHERLARLERFVEAMQTQGATDPEAC